MPKDFSFEIEHDPVSKVTHIKMVGFIYRDSLREFAVELIESLKASSSRLVLNDAIKARIRLTDADIYSLPSVLRDAGMPSEVICALVVKHDVRAFRHFEKASLEVGLSIRVFTDMGEAAFWLARQSRTGRDTSETA